VGAPILSLMSKAGRGAAKTKRRESYCGEKWKVRGGGARREGGLSSLARKGQSSKEERRGQKV